MRYEFSRVGETVNCFNCGMETVLFIPGMAPPYSEEQYVLEVREMKWGRNQFGLRHVEGVVQNLSSKNLDWARIEFILSDKAGVAVGSTSDCVINLPAQGTWKFQAVVVQPEAARVSEPILTCEYGRIARAKAAWGPTPATPRAA